MQRHAKVTAAESPKARIRRAHALIDWCERFDLRAEHRRLLSAVLDGKRGLALAQALCRMPWDVDRLEHAFRKCTGMSVYEAAIEVGAQATRPHHSTLLPAPTAAALAPFRAS